MIKDLFSSQKLAAANAPRAETKASAPLPAAKAEMPKAEPTKPAKAPPVESKPAPVAAVAPAPAPAPAAPPDDADKARAVAAVESWAKAWSAKDVEGYLSHYASDFEVPGGASRAAWEKERTERIQRPKKIEVTVKVLNAKASGDEATVTIRQSYRSDTLKSNSTKTLRLVRQGDRWLIKQEHAGG
jgi:ketosteroid isomerase-like protein